VRNAGWAKTGFAQQVGSAYQTNSSEQYRIDEVAAERHAAAQRVGSKRYQRYSSKNYEAHQLLRRTQRARYNVMCDDYGCDFPRGA